jgi:hypothetical protein
MPSGSVFLSPSAGCGCLCNVFFYVQSCRGGTATFGLANAFVSVWTDSTKTTFLASGTTDGISLLSLPIGAGSRYYEVTPSSRWVKATGTVTVACGQTVVIVPTPASGYRCASCCHEPLANTLHASSTCGGGGILTWNGFNWTDLSTHFFTDCSLQPGNSMGPGCIDPLTNYPGSGPCPPALSLTFFIGANTITVTE